MSTTKNTILKLIKKNISISTAESCTGGLIASAITRIAGASKIFSSGIVCYSNKAKTKYLSISKITLKKYGAVSSNVASEMVNNLFLKERTNICISTTGIAGPGGGNKKKPVGLVFVGIKFHDKTYVFQKNYKGSRLEIQRKTKEFVFKKINQLI